DAHLLSCSRRRRRFGLPTLPLHAALPICRRWPARPVPAAPSAPPVSRSCSRLSYATSRLRLKVAPPGARCKPHGGGDSDIKPRRSEEHTSELQSRENLVCRLLPEKKNRIQ